MNTSSGLRPDAGDFLLFGQEKSHQREGRPGVARGARTLCCLLDLGGCGTRTMRPRAPTCSNSPRRHPRGQSSCSARTVPTASGATRSDSITSSRRNCVASCCAQASRFMTFAAADSTRIDASARVTHSGAVGAALLHRRSWGPARGSARDVTPLAGEFHSRRGQAGSTGYALQRATPGRPSLW